MRMNNWRKFISTLQDSTMYMSYTILEKRNISFSYDKISPTYHCVTIQLRKNSAKYNVIIVVRETSYVSSNYFKSCIVFV